MMEVGKKRAVACAFDWPGWDRAAKTAESALEVLETYRPRYARVAGLAGLADQFAAAGTFTVVETVEGTGTTDFHGVSAKPAAAEQVPMTAAECDRKVALLNACWSYFDDVASRVSEELRKGPRGGGRDRQKIVRHTNIAEMSDFAKKVGVVTSLEAWRSADETCAHREAFSAAIKDYNARQAPARTWALQFLIRRCAYHMLDHAWEMEDKDLTEDA